MKRSPRIEYDRLVAIRADMRNVLEMAFHAYDAPLDKTKDEGPEARSAMVRVQIWDNLLDLLIENWRDSAEEMIYKIAKRLGITVVVVIRAGSEVGKKEVSE